MKNSYVTLSHSYIYAKPCYTVAQKNHPRKPTLPHLTYRVTAMASTVDDTTEAVSNLTMETEGTMSKEYVPKTPLFGWSFSY